MKDVKYSKAIRLDMNKELEKARLGKPTKLPVELVLLWAVRDYPDIRRMLAKAFSIT